MESIPGDPTPAVNIRLDKTHVEFVKSPKAVNVTLSSKVPEKMLEHKGIILKKGDVFCFFDQCIASNESYKIACVSNSPGQNASILGLSSSNLAQLQAIPKFLNFYNFISTKYDFWHNKISDILVFYFTYFYVSYRVDVIMKRPQFKGLSSVEVCFRAFLLFFCVSSDCVSCK